MSMFLPSETVLSSKCKVLFSKLDVIILMRVAMGYTRLLDGPGPASSFQKVVHFQLSKVAMVPISMTNFFRRLPSFTIIWRILPN